MTAGAVSATTGLTGLINATTSGRVNHSGLGGATCVSCHNGVAAVGKAISHPSTSNNCSACHATIAWAPAHVDHAEAHGTCSACHNGALATTKPVHHVTTHLDCDACHTTSLWKPAVFDHAGVLHGTCLSCHSAATAVKSTSHPATSLSCDSCHYTVAWLPIKPLRPEVKTPAVIVPRQPVQMPVRPGFGRSLPHLIVP